MKKLMQAINWVGKTLGRFMFAIPFAIFGAFHFMNAGQMAGMVPIPGGVIIVYLTGIALILASASMIIGKKDKLATFFLGIFLILTTLTVHMPGMMEAQTAGDQMSVQLYTSNVLKDMALAGAAWMYAGSVGARDKS